MSKRPIEDSSSDILSSPCDGRILSISEVKDMKDLIIVKDVRYSLMNFLFGKFFEVSPEMTEGLFQQDKKTYQITIYLSPGDCHRYFSPNNIFVSHRIYVPGFLEPVRPSYLEKHPNVFETNERVTLRCTKENSDDVLYISYVGALNVGSINLNFDDFLKTNSKLKENEINDPGFFIMNYADVVSPGNKKLERHSFMFYKPSTPLLIKDLQKESEEFDMRDMLDIDLDVVSKYKIKLDELKIPFAVLKERLIFEGLQKENENLKFNYSNSFLSYDVDFHKRKKKLNSPKEMSLENYKVTNKGVQIDKREEMGWFNFGSTIVLIFTVDKNKDLKFRFNSGDVVKIGQSLFEINEKASKL